MKQKTIKMAIKRKFPMIDYNETLDLAIKKMTAHNVSVLAVKVQEELVGLVTNSDVMYSLAEGHSLSDTKISEFMTTCEFNTSRETRNPCIQLDEDENALSAIKLMYEAGVNHLLVSGSAGRAVGIVSSLDIIRLFGKEMLEEQEAA